MAEGYLRRMHGGANNSKPKPFSDDLRVVSALSLRSSSRTAEEERRASLAVCGWAENAEDARSVMDMLGLL